MQAHEQLGQFCGELLRRLEQIDPSRHGIFFERMEAAFKLLGYREEIPSGVENILIVRIDVVGDMILTSGFIREVRRNFPQARITLVVSPRVYPIVELCPYVNEILVFDTNRFKNFPLYSDFLVMAEAVALFCRENLWRRKFSLAFSPQWGTYNLWGLLMCWLSGARERVGFGEFPYKSWTDTAPDGIVERDNFLLTKNIVTPRSVISELEKNFYLLTAVGLMVEQTHLELWFEEADALHARELLKNIPPTCKKVLLGLGAGGASRKYPPEKYLVALKELIKKNLFFVMVGGQSELEDAKFIEENLPPEKVLNLVGQTTLRETEAVVSQMDFYLGNATGIMHMSAAAQVPVLTIYRGVADKEDYLPGLYSEVQRFPPWQTKAVILQPDHQLEECARRGVIYGWCHAGEPHCITQITPQEIIAGFEILEEL